MEQQREEAEQMQQRLTTANLALHRRKNTNKTKKKRIKTDKVKEIRQTVEQQREEVEQMQQRLTTANLALRAGEEDLKVQVGSRG